MITTICELCDGSGKKSEGDLWNGPEPCDECKGRGKFIQLEEDDFVYVQLNQVDKPRNGHMNVAVGRWWCVHPTKGLAFFNPKSGNGKRRSGHGNPYGSPQCNRDEAISKRLCPEWCEVKFVEVVYLPLIMSDYC